MIDETHHAPSTEEDKPLLVAPPEFRNDTETMERVLTRLRELDAA